MRKHAGTRTNTLRMAVLTKELKELAEKRAELLYAEGSNEHYALMSARSAFVYGVMWTHSNRLKRKEITDALTDRPTGVSAADAVVRAQRNKLIETMLP